MKSNMMLPVLNEPSNSASIHSGAPVEGQILLVKPPFFTPLTPPLGIGILKSYISQHGFEVKCLDLNTDTELWDTHHRYFEALQKLEQVSSNDGYSKLWWIMNAHMLAFLNGASPNTIIRVLKQVIPLYWLHATDSVLASLLPIVECFFRRLEQRLSSIDWTGVGLVGTSTYTTSLSASLYLLRWIKRLNPRIRTVMGGGVFADDFALGSENLETLSRECDFVDHIVLGEGEKLFLKLLEGELSGKRVITIADLAGTTIAIKEVPPPDFSDLDMASYFHLTVEGGRSCPFQCSFCSETTQWGDYRKKPSAMFATQLIELAQRCNNRSFFLGDSLMNPYITQLWPELIERKAGILYDGYLRADKIATDRNRTRDWARSGMYRVRLGIESAARRVLDLMHKMTTPETISEALKSLASAGIRTTTYWITGFPGETEEDFNETLTFVREHRDYIYELEAHPYYYYPYGQVGSRLYECQSLYSPEVTEVIKFKAWEIIHASPAREERYNRLRRLSALAGELGIPNLYTMAQVYVAEERWAQLHPLAIEVYQGSHDRRELPPESSTPGQDIMGAVGAYSGRIYCYRLSVHKKIARETLQAAMEELLRFHAGLLRESGPEWDSVKLHDASVAEGEPLSEVLDPGLEDFRRSGRCISAMVINRSLDPRQPRSDVIFMARAPLIDAWTVCLLVIDLVRLYEQLSQQIPIFLLTPSRTYNDFLETGWTRTARQPHSNVARLANVTTSVLQMAQPTNGTGVNMRPQIPYILSTAVLNALADSDEKFSLAVALDYRADRPEFRQTAGRMVQYHGAPEKFSPRRLDGTMACFEDLHHVRRDPLWQPGRLRVLFNLEYLLSAPWAGGDEWRPASFVTGPMEHSVDCDLEIVPWPTESGMRLDYLWNDPAVGSIVDRLIPQVSLRFSPWTQRWIS